MKAGSRRNGNRKGNSASSETSQQPPPPATRQKTKKTLSGATLNMRFMQRWKDRQEKKEDQKVGQHQQPHQQQHQVDTDAELYNSPVRKTREKQMTSAAPQGSTASNSPGTNHTRNSHGALSAFSRDNRLPAQGAPDSGQETTETLSTTLNHDDAPIRFPLPPAADVAIPVRVETATPAEMYGLPSLVLGRRSFGGFHRAVEEAWFSSKEHHQQPDQVSSASPRSGKRKRRAS